MNELAYVYVDCGDPQYKILVHEMVTSARAVMPDVKITQISDNKTPIYPGADALFNAEVECDKDSVTYFKGHFMAEFAMQCEDDLILCDVDLLWQKPVIFEKGTAAIRCLYRENMASMPYNTGLILSRSKYAKELWQDYIEVIDSLAANGMGTWYCDQIAAAICWNNAQSQSIPLAETLPMDEWAYAPTGPDDDGGKDAYAIHLKGDRKKWLRNFAKRAA
jgi:hypothetical protein